MNFLRNFLYFYKRGFTALNAAKAARRNTL